MTSIFLWFGNTVKRLIGPRDPPHRINDDWSAAWLEASLALALERGPHGEPDFLWAADAKAGIVKTWHPDPAISDWLRVSQYPDILFHLCLASRPGCPDLAAAIAEQECCDNLEVEWQDADGRQHCWHVSTRPLAGKTCHTLGLVRDMTQSARLCRELRQDQCTVRDQQDLTGRIAGVFATSLRQQINIVSSYAEALAGSAETCSAGTGRAETCSPEDFKKTIEQLLATASRMRDYTRSAAGRLTIRPEICHINGLLGEAAVGLSEKLRRQKMFLDVAFSKEIARVYADIAYVREVVHLLAGQAATLAVPGSILRIGASAAGGPTASLTVRYKSVGSCLPGEYRREHEPVSASDPFLGGQFIDMVVGLHRGRLDYFNQPGSNLIVLSLPVAVCNEANASPGDEALQASHLLRRL